MPGEHLRCLENCNRFFKDEEFVSIFRSGIGHLNEFLHAFKDCGGVWVTGTWPGSREHYDALATEVELTRIGAGLSHLAGEEARFRSVVAEAEWTRCQAEMARVEAVLDHLQARLAGLGAAAVEEGRSRLANKRGRLNKVAAEAKHAWLCNAIREVTDRRLSSMIVVEVSGRDVSIRAKARCEGDREDLRRTIASLPGLKGYCTKIAIEIA